MKEHDALQVRQTEAIHEDVRAQSREGAGEVPAAEGAQGVLGCGQAQATRVDHLPSFPEITPSMDSTFMLLGRLDCVLGALVDMGGCATFQPLSVRQSIEDAVVSIEKAMEALRSP
jgi:hypothetical protein